MSKPLYQLWVEDMIRWTHREVNAIEHAAELIYKELRRGVTPTTPPDTGTT